MKIYPISDNAIETIQWKHDGESYALVHISKLSAGNIYRATALSKRDALMLYQAIQASILNLVKENSK